MASPVQTRWHITPAPLLRVLLRSLLGGIITLLIAAAGLMPSRTLVDARPLEPPAGVTAWPDGLPVYDHVVIVVEENKDYDQIIGNAKAEYINGTLCAEGANLTQMFGEEHHSQGNYFWLFSGSNHNVGFRDGVPHERFDAPNLGAALIAKGRTFRGYAEDLPEAGYEDPYAPPGAKKKDRRYARKHVPWISFSNVPNTADAATSCNLPFLEFPKDPAKFDTLPTVAIVIPNLFNDMHNGEVDDSVPLGDEWLRKNINAYFRWAKEHNSLLIVTWDENDLHGRNDPADLGLTDPSVAPMDLKTQIKQNRIATIFAGAHVKHGNFAEGKGVTHVNILRTLEAMYGLPRAGAQQPKAAAAGIRDDVIITDVFQSTN